MNVHVQLHRCNLCTYINYNINEVIIHKFNHGQIGRGPPSTYLDEGPFKVIGNFKGFIKTVRQINSKDFVSFFDYMGKIKPFVKAIITNGLIDFDCLKSQMTVWVTFRRLITKNEFEYTKKPINSNMIRVLSKHYIDEYIQLATQKIEDTISTFHAFGSGWMFDRVNGMDIRIGRYQPLRVGCHMDLPDVISKKRVIVNIKNKDEKCFMWSILSILHPPQRNKKNPSRTETYKEFIPLYNFTCIEYPLEISKIKIFENKNSIAVNIFHLNGEAFLPYRISKYNYTNNYKTVNLLMQIDLENNQSHFYGIKDINKIFNSTNCHKRNICYNCLNTFAKKVDMNIHYQLCLKNEATPIRYPKGENGYIPQLLFNNIRKQVKVGYVLYADFESILKPEINEEDSNDNLDPLSRSMIRKVNSHQVSGFSYTLIRLDGKVVKHRIYRGLDCIDIFLNEIGKIQSIIQAIYSCNTPITWSPQIDLDLEVKNECFICDKPFTPTDGHVIDHCHLTGNYRGLAHRGCNLNYQQSCKLPVIIHNFRNYDSHLIIRGFGKFGKDFFVIPTNSEKYLSVTIDDKIVFLDSYQFLSASLETLVENLKQEGLKKFDIISQVFNKSKINLLNESLIYNYSDSIDHLLQNDPQNKILTDIFSPKSIDLLTRKGVYPYEYIDDFKRFDEENLPEIKYFYNKLKDSSISDEDYEHAKNVFDHFKCKSLGDFHNLYLGSDSLLLACVFENFRSIALQYYKLDPVHYYSAPGFAWDAALKMTRVSLDLITDDESNTDMYLFFERGMRGGISQISKRRAKANNKYLKDFDSSKPSSYLLALDMNNLYGYAMSQPLPIGDFKWIDDFNSIDFSKVSDESDEGYILEVDLDYPPGLHDDHNDYPLAPEKVAIPVNMFGNYQKNLMDKLEINYNEKQVKLITHLGPRKNYILHYRNLKYYIEKGLKVTKIHRALSFKQKAWLEPYIQFNTKMRANARNDFEKSFFKLLNNAVYGKTMENKRRRISVRLVNNVKSVKRYVSSPNYISHNILTDELATIEMKPEYVLLDKPVYCGFAILELSKLAMYNFHYDIMKCKYNENIQLLFTDTDSLMYHIKTEDVYADMLSIIDNFDTSSYPKNHILYSEKHKKVIGKMHDESDGSIISEFVGVCPKTYSWVGESMGKNALKGVPKFIQKRDFKHSTYISVLEDQTKLFSKFLNIRSKDHNIGTFEMTKLSLHAFDSKRYIVENGIDTLSYGHFKI